MSPAEDKAPEIPAAPTAESVRAPGIGLIEAALVSILVVVATGLALSLLPSAWLPSWARPAQAQRIVYVNTAAIVNAALRRVAADPAMNDEKITAEAKRFGDAIQSRIDAWTAEGVLVLNGAAVLGVPPELDLTADMARAVGVDMGVRVTEEKGAK